jgi:hypothetical protein
MVVKVDATGVRDTRIRNERSDTDEPPGGVVALTLHRTIVED